MDKLLPCPFCGETEDLHATIHEVICGNCSCHVGSMNKTPETNAEIWNTRQAQAEIEELRLRNKALTDALKQVSRYQEPDVFAPDGELLLDLSPVINERVLKLIRENGL